MTSVPPTLTALTPAELRLQQQKRMQLYAGLSQGLRVAVQVTYFADQKHCCHDAPSTPAPELPS
jgi:hypothetical protein